MLDHGGHGNEPVETEPKGKAKPIFTAMWPPIFENVHVLLFLLYLILDPF